MENTNGNNDIKYNFNSLFICRMKIKTRYTFVYRSADGHYMRPESFLNINKGRTLSSSQLRALGITKVKTNGLAPSEILQRTGKD